MSDYIELHARSAFSFLRGASQPEELVVMAAAAGMRALALTDRDGVYGSARAHYTAEELGRGECVPFNDLMEARALGKRDVAPSRKKPWEDPTSLAPPAFAEIRSITGAELSLADGTALPVLVRERVGYRNLCRLLTRMHLRSAKGEGRIGWEELAEFAEGLVCLTGDEEGALRQAVAADRRERAEGILRRLTGIFGPGNVYVELQRQELRGENWVNRRLVELAEAARLPILATNGVCYARPAGRLVLDAFTCLRHHTTLDAAGRLLSRNSQRCLKSPREMHALFADLPEALANTVRLAESLPFVLTDLGYEFPGYATTGGESVADALRRKTYEGARSLYGPCVPEKVRDSVDKELPLIEGLGFCGYFLHIHELILHAKHAGIMIQGRGSASSAPGARPTDALPGRTWTWTCPAATGARRSSNMCTRNSPRAGRP
jgi:error-prone DNA polymerase